MKKIVYSLLAASLLAGLTACSDDDKTVPSSKIISKKCPLFGAFLFFNAKKINAPINALVIMSSTRNHPVLKESFLLDRI